MIACFESVVTHTAYGLQYNKGRRQISTKSGPRQSQALAVHFNTFTCEDIEEWCSLGSQRQEAGRMRRGPEAQEILVTQRGNPRKQIKQRTKRPWHKHSTSRRNNLAVSGYKIQVFALSIGISTLVPGVQAGRRDEQICRR